MRWELVSACQLIDVLVGCSRMAPPHRLTHCGADESFPGRPVGEELEAPRYCPFELGEIVRLEQDPGGGADRQSRFIGIDDGIGEAAGVSRNRDRAVAQTVELGKAAGLEARRDEDGIATADEKMGQ